MSARSEIPRITLCSFGICFFLFVLISLLSFQNHDWPNPDVFSTDLTGNLCGPVGAFLAYYSQYYLGPATLFLVLTAIVWLVMVGMRKEIDQPILRAIGILLIATVLSSSRYLINAGDTGSLSIGNGGILGIAIGHFLLSNTAITGSILVLVAGFIVGLLLAADNLLLLLPKLFPFMLQRIRHSWATLADAQAEMRVAKPAKTKGGLFKKMVEKLTILPTREKKVAPASKTIIFEAPPMLDVEEDVEEKNSEEIEMPLFLEDDDEAAAVEAERKQLRRDKSLKHVSSALAKLRGFAKPVSSSDANNSVDYSEYKYPSLDMLKEPQTSYTTLQEKVVREKGRILAKTLLEFKIDANVVEAETGPVITMFELELAPGIKVARITSLANDLARALGAPSVRVVAPLPGRHTVGIEVPNSVKEKVRLKELIQLAGEMPSKMQIPLFLGKDASGNPLIIDLTDMPHCLIAGTTGSGKSVCINSIIMSILLTQRPDMVKMILIDPKMVEMNAFRDLAHLMCPIVTEMKKAEQILEWLSTKMDERYAILAEAKVRNIINFNKLTEEEIYERFSPSTEEEKARIPLKLPYLVVIIDELADLMMMSAKEVESYIVRLAQKSRAVGIHLILATQRPQATVVTGLIKSNMPSRISFRVASRMDSRIVLDQNGAETLLGQGDMLFLKPGSSDLIRSQGTFIDDSEINNVVKYLKEIAEPSYHHELVQMNSLAEDTGERDELFDDAVRIILESRRGSVSLLQRRLTIGYSRASRLIDQMAAAGIVGEFKGSQAREVLLTLDEFEQIRHQMERDAVMGYKDMADGDESFKLEAEPDSGGAVAVAEPVEEIATPSEDIDTEDEPETEEEVEEDEEIVDDTEEAEEECAEEVEEETDDADEEESDGEGEEWEYVEVEVEEEVEEDEIEEEEKTEAV